MFSFIPDWSISTPVGMIQMVLVSADGLTKTHWYVASSKSLILGDTKFLRSDRMWANWSPSPQILLSYTTGSVVHFWHVDSWAGPWHRIPYQHCHFYMITNLKRSTRSYSWMPARVWVAGSYEPPLYEDGRYPLKRKRCWRKVKARKRGTRRRHMPSFCLTYDNSWPMLAVSISILYRILLQFSSTRPNMTYQ